VHCSFLIVHFPHGLRPPASGLASLATRSATACSERTTRVEGDDSLTNAASRFVLVASKVRAGTARLLSAHRAGMDKDTRCKNGHNRKLGPDLRLHLLCSALINPQFPGNPEPAEGILTHQCPQPPLTSPARIHN